MKSGLEITKKKKEERWKLPLFFVLFSFKYGKFFRLLWIKDYVSGEKYKAQIICYLRCEVIRLLVESRVRICDLKDR